MVNNFGARVIYLVGAILLIVGLMMAICSRFVEDERLLIYMFLCILLLASGFLFYSLGIHTVGWFEGLGQPILFNNQLKQNKVYRVVEKIPGKLLFLIKEEEEKGRSGIVEIPKTSEGVLKKGRRFVRYEGYGDGIAILTP